MQALGSGITLDSVLAKDHGINAVVHDAKVTTAGYQGTVTPNQWFGGPALIANDGVFGGRIMPVRAGSMVLRDAQGLVVDSLNYGLIVDPWAAEGYQGTSGSSEMGCRVAAPGAGVSSGRLPDGHDTDSNCNDFQSAPFTTLAAASEVGVTNVKVASVAGFAVGQPIKIDTGSGLEDSVIAVVGTGGATTVTTAVTAGATDVPVANVMGFSAGHAITIGSGADLEKAAIVSVNRFGATITVAAPLRLAHAVGAQVSGTGITITTPLKQAHANGAPVTGGVPTPGSANQYYSKR